MTDWFELVLSNQAPWWRLMIDATGGEVHEEEGLQATIARASPKRSFFNSVHYSDTDRLISALERLAELYDEAGVEAWTVWVPRQDEEARAALQDAGHRLDAEPRAMGIDLDELSVPDPDPELEIVETTDPTAEQLETGRRINEIAYGYSPGDFPPMTSLPGTELYLAVLDGETVGSTVGWDRDIDTEITFVATLPEARGRGVSKRLMARALERARGRGQKASTLIATKLGFPVYMALGYREYGILEMWERRGGD